METERLLFRRWEDSDAEILFKYASDPELGPRAGWPPHKNVEESLNIIHTIYNKDSVWAMVLKETGEPAGCIGYFTHNDSNIEIGENDAEIGYWVGKPFWNKGLCTEALREIIDYCFNIKGFTTLWCDYFIDNPASGRVMEKCGFVNTGKQHYCTKLYNGEDRPVQIMKLEYAL